MTMSGTKVETMLHPTALSRRLKDLTEAESDG